MGGRIDSASYRPTLCPASRCLAAEASAVLTRAKLGTEAVVHTTLGDIFVRLMPDIAPKVRDDGGWRGRMGWRWAYTGHVMPHPPPPQAVENFTTHSRAGYYSGTLFHR